MVFFYPVMVFREGPFLNRAVTYSIQVNIHKWAQVGYHPNNDIQEGKLRMKHAKPSLSTGLQPRNSLLPWACVAAPAVRNDCWDIIPRPVPAAFWSFQCWCWSIILLSTTYSAETIQQLQVRLVLNIPLFTVEIHFELPKTSLGLTCFQYGVCLEQ